MRMDEAGKKEDGGSLIREGGPVAAAAAGCRNVSNVCPLDDLAPLEFLQYLFPPLLGHVKVSSGGGSRRVHAHTLGNTIARRDITSTRKVEAKHSSVKKR
ncbi:hypothetical protein Q8A73_007519 [Channa argus]|nr:hypothetical protein Q8A73_007519 [Channa argus]